MLSVTHFYREPRKTGLSIEGIFNLVKQCLTDKVIIRDFYCDPALSRIKNTVRARKYSSEINHITGDVNFLALALGGKKNILTIHDLGHLETLRKHPIKHLIYKYFWFSFPLKYIDIVTVVSQFTKSKLIEYFNFPEEKIRLIHNPIKPIFRYNEKKILNTPTSILMMGTGKHKNLNNLIEASRDTDFHLDIVGWPDEDELNKLKAYNISHTIYNRLTDQEIYERYIACDIMYNASFYEGFGMPIIEAQSVGRPVVTSNIGAMKEVAGNTAMLVDPHKPEEIKNAILKLSNDNELYNKMIRLGLSNIAAYQYDFIAQQYLDVYFELAKQAPCISIY